MNKNLIKSLKQHRGSITIEAAIIFPFIVLLFMMFFSLMHIGYTHSKIQFVLNKISKEISYDAYGLYQLGVIEKLQEGTAFFSGDPLTREEIIAFETGLEHQTIEESINLIASNPQVISAQSLSPNPISFIEKTKDGLNKLVTCIDVGNRIGKTLGTEGVYFITTTVARSYFEEKLKEYLDEEFLDLNIKIEHLEAFGETDAGRIVVSYGYDFPLNLFSRKPMRLRNSSYLHLYAGQGDYNEKQHNPLEESNYGRGSKDSLSLEDEDGFYKEVFVTKHGIKYHKNPICFHIEVNAIPLPLGSIPNKVPCEHCAKGTKVVGLVFTTLSSNVYHSSPTCHAIYHESSILSEKEAIIKGYDPCGTCSK